MGKTYRRQRELSRPKRHIPGERRERASLGDLAWDEVDYGIEDPVLVRPRRRRREEEL